MKIVILSSILIVGVFCRPSEKATQQFPKKYDPSVHSDFKKKTPLKEITPEESSYFSYDPTEELEVLVPPHMLERMFYEDLYRNAYPSRFVYDTAVGNPSDTLTAPQEDTYMSPEGIPLGGLGVPLPLESEIPAEEPQSYLSYDAQSTKDNVPMVAPKQSSYAMLKSDQAQVSLPSEPQLPLGLKAPAADAVPEESESSYTSYVKPADSSYMEYDRSSPLDVMQPPPIV